MPLVVETFGHGTHRPRLPCIVNTMAADDLVMQVTRALTAMVCLEYSGLGTWAHLNIKTVFSWCGDSHVKDKTVVRPSYLSHGDPYTGKATSLY